MSATTKDRTAPTSADVTAGATGGPTSPPTRRRRQHYRGPLALSTGTLVFRYTVLSIVAILFLIPFWVMVKFSLATNESVQSPDFVFLPIPPSFDNYINVFGDPAFWAAMRGSALMAVLQTGLSIVIAAMAGYGLARIRSRFSNLVLAITLLVLMIPSATTFIPNFIIVASLGWVGTLQGLVVPTLFAAFTVFMFRQAFLNFPRELEEAGRLDGLTNLGVFARIVVPNVIPFAAALTVLGFVGSWNSFLWPLVVAGQGFGISTVQVYLSTFLTAQTFDYTGLFAAALVSMLPMLVVFFALQRLLVRGVAETGLTG